MRAARLVTRGARAARACALAAAGAASAATAFAAAAPSPPPAAAAAARPTPLPLPASLQRLDALRDDTAGWPREAVLAETLRSLGAGALAPAEAHPDLLWRAARAAYDVAELDATPAARKRELVVQGARWMEAARARVAECASPGPLHRWAGILKSAEGKQLSTKEYIAATYKIREEWEEAVRLDSGDASALHLLGRWHFDVASLGWVQRQVASALFASPPTSSFEAALSHFERAEAVQPRFWKANHLMLAETLVRLGRGADALRWMQSGLALPVKTLYDQQSHDKILALWRSVDAAACAAFVAAAAAQGAGKGGAIV